MRNINLANSKHEYTSLTVTKKDTTEYKIYTPEILDKYKEYSKKVLKFTNDKTKTKFIMYNKVLKWYKNENSINIDIEKIHIRSKLGSYSSGGCGLGASLLAGVIASGIFSYMDHYIKEIKPLYFFVYSILILVFGLKILSNEDDKVEMYNMFLEALNKLEYDKNDN